MAKIREKERESRSNCLIGARWAWSIFSSGSTTFARNTTSMISRNSETSTLMATTPSLASTLPSNPKSTKLSLLESSSFFPFNFYHCLNISDKMSDKMNLCALFCFNRFPISKMLGPIFSFFVHSIKYSCVTWVYTQSLWWLWHDSLNFLLVTWFSTNSFKFCRKLKQHQWRPIGRLRLQWRQRFVGPRPDCWRKFLSFKNWHARR